MSVTTTKLGLQGTEKGSNRTPTWEDQFTRPPQSYLSASWDKLRRDRVAMIALVGLALIAFLSFSSSWTSTVLLRKDPNEVNLDETFAPPSTEHWLGTDELGRDELSRLLNAGRVSLSIGVAVSIVSMTLGVMLGLISGFFGGLVDDVSNAIIQTLMNVPITFLLILLALLFHPGPLGLAAIIGITSWMGTARLVRGKVFSLRERDYIDAARMVGAGNWRIMMRHVLPNVVSLIVVIAAFEVAAGIMIESGLSFLGMGVQPPTASWGNMLINSREYALNAWWLVAAPGMIIFLTMLFIFLLANGLRDALDPWVKQ